MNSVFSHYQTFGYRPLCKNIGNLPQREAQCLLIINKIHSSSYVNNQALTIKKNFYWNICFVFLSGIFIGFGQGLMTHIIHKNFDKVGMDRLLKKLFH